MKQRLMTPGPTPVPEETLLEMARPVFYHRSAQFRKLLAEVTEDLQYVFCTKNPVLTLACSGTGGMEAAVASSLPAGSKAICAIAGRWGERWRNLCKAIGVEVISVIVPPGQAVPPDAVAAALAEHPDVAAVCATLSETATGVRNDIAAFGKITAAANAILIVDSISGLGVVECRTDAWGIDINITGSQKALMLPPGLAFVSVSAKAWQRIDANTQARTFYFDLKRYRDNLKNFDTPFTPAHTLVRALKVSLKRLREEGLENIWARQARIAAATRAAVAALGLELFAAVPVDGLTVFKVPAGIDGSELVGNVEKRYGVRLAGGQDTLKGKIVRIGHMGYIDQWDVLAMIASLELTLLEMGYAVKPGVGVAAFQKALAETVLQGTQTKEG
jgi:aspartate aminotransferase-like enzyme